MDNLREGIAWGPRVAKPLHQLEKNLVPLGGSYFVSLFGAICVYDCFVLVLAFVFLESALHVCWKGLSFLFTEEILYLGAGQCQKSSFMT